MHLPCFGEKLASIIGKDALGKVDLRSQSYSGLFFFPLFKFIFAGVTIRPYIKQAYNIAFRVSQPTSWQPYVDNLELFLKGALPFLLYGTVFIYSFSAFIYFFSLPPKRGISISFSIPVFISNPTIPYGKEKNKKQSQFE